MTDHPDTNPLDPSEADRASTPGRPYASTGMTDRTIELSILIEARPETVYSILSEPARFGDWMGTSECRFAPSPGSPFEALFPNFGTTLKGEILEVVPNEKLALSWGFSEGPQAEAVPPGSSQVEILLRPEGARTRITLIHSGLPAEEFESHKAGWRFNLGRLALKANRAYLSAAMEVLADSFFGAWNEPEAEARRALLLECCSEDVAFSDEYATLDGLDMLAMHIGSTQGFFPGASVEQDGDVRIVHGQVLIPWRIVDAEAKVTQRGTNLVIVSAEGRIQRVVGFWGE